MTDSPIGFAPQPTQALFTRLLTDLRDRGITGRTEAVTGRVADIAEARRGAVAEVLDIEKRLADTRTIRDSIALAQSRSATIQASLTGIEDSANALLAEATVALQAGTRDALETLAVTAGDMLGQATGALNVSLAGRSLFAGDVSGAGAVTPASDLLAASAGLLNGPLTVADARTALADYFNDATPAPVYLGGTLDAPAVEVGPEERIDYTVRADRQALRDTLRTVATIAAAHDPATTTTLDEAQRRQLVEDAVAELRNQVGALNGLRAEIGSAEARIEEARVRTNAEESRLTASYNALTGRDTLEAAAEMQAIEGQLETLFLTTARFSQLTLTNFLR